MAPQMTSTLRSLLTATCAILAAASVTVPVFGQVPAGVPYEPNKHPNPIVTWVKEKDFRKTSLVDAAATIGVELMSLSKDQGERVSVEIASPSPAKQKIQIINEEYEVTFYPVMRQTYKLKSGKTFVLYTFKYPRALTTPEFLNRTAFGRAPRGTVPRFGPVPFLERIDIRVVPGIYMVLGQSRTVYWFELGAGYSVTTDAPKDELFKVIEDLL